MSSSQMNLSMIWVRKFRTLLLWSDTRHPTQSVTETQLPLVLTPGVCDKIRDKTKLLTGREEYWKQTNIRLVIKWTRTSLKWLKVAIFLKWQECSVCGNIAWYCSDTLLEIDTIKDYQRLSWTIMNYHELPWAIMSFHELSWTIMDYHGLSWTIMDYHGLSWTIMD